MIGCGEDKECLIVDVHFAEKVFVVCIHGKCWPEGDSFEDKDGKACRECVESKWYHA